MFAVKYTYIDYMYIACVFIGLSESEPTSVRQLGAHTRHAPSISNIVQEVLLFTNTLLYTKYLRSRFRQGDVDVVIDRFSERIYSPKSTKISRPSPTQPLQLPRPPTFPSLFLSLPLPKRINKASNPWSLRIVKKYCSYGIHETDIGSSEEVSVITDVEKETSEV